MFSLVSFCVLNQKNYTSAHTSSIPMLRLRLAKAAFRGLRYKSSASSSLPSTALEVQTRVQSLFDERLTPLNEKLCGKRISSSPSSLYSRSTILPLPLHHQPVRLNYDDLTLPYISFAPLLSYPPQLAGVIENSL